MRFYKRLFVFSVLLSLTAFVLGCGGESTVTPDSDPVMTGSGSDPTLDESDTDPSGDPTKTDNSGKSSEPEKKP